MKTIHKVASAASKAIWGEDQARGEEPVSGKMGNVAAGEPYDAGNMGKPKDAAGTSTPSQTEPVATTTRTTGTAAPQPMTKPEPEVATKPRFVDEKSPTGSTGQASNDPAGPARFAPSAVGMRDDSTKAQNDTRSPAGDNIDTSRSMNDTTGFAGIPGTATAAPTPGDKTDRTADKEEAISPKTSTRSGDDGGDLDQPVNLEGPGPRPLEEVAREHGGDAGAREEIREPEQHQQQHQSAASTGVGAGKAPGGIEGGADAAAGHQRRDSGKGIGDEGEVGGKGEEYVRSSGLAADGGDFDASRPGAGREADRLLEQKGLHQDTHSGSHHHGGHGANTTTGHAENGGKEKHGLKEKIKAKMHRNSTSA
ncbi:hypothetical protein P885DRAFT_56356 [Corynascus similis CBS 632.67]